MPLQIPSIDDRRYQELLNEALARIPVHNPQWTNFNKSDPGVTLIEIFAFMTESLLYRSNQIPERNRLKFLSLLGLPLRPASSARGLLVFSNERGPLTTVTLNGGIEARAGQVPFHTTQGLDVLPVEGQVYYKHPLRNPSNEQKSYYEQLYASLNDPANPTPPAFVLYETLPLQPNTGSPLDLGRDTVDGALWVALMVRANDKPYADSVRTARKEIAGKTISLGVVPFLESDERRLTPGGRANRADVTLLHYQIPKLPPQGLLPAKASERVAQYQVLDAVSDTDVLSEPGVVQITLPANESELELWKNLEPIESGSDKFPPALEDTNLNDRIITWLRITAIGASSPRLLWAGINAVAVTQRAHISNELLPAGTGEPDQTMKLSKTPVLAGSVRLTVNDPAKPWRVIDDILSAGPEVPVHDDRLAPGQPVSQNARVDVFTINLESGEIRFGDGLRGRRPPFGATIRASYDYGMGREGNVGAGSINSSPTLPAGFKVSNPVPTWGGAEAETVRDGERQIARYLQHRDRMVSTMDFETLTLRTPGVNVGRVEVLPAFNPALVPNSGGDAPGAVTLLVIPKYDPAHPDSPEPDRYFMDAVCAYIDERRLVTTEVFLRAPDYKPIWISIGIEVVPGTSVAEVRAAVKTKLMRFLSPLPPDHSNQLENQMVLFAAPQYASMQRGWPLGKAVSPLELLAVASSVPGVLKINKIYVADALMMLSQDAQSPDAPTCSDLPVTLSGLQLPRVMALNIAIGEALSINQLRGDEEITPAPVAGQTQTPPAPPSQVILPVPVIPDEC
jgi:Baseplate J-like protein.